MKIGIIVGSTREGNLGKTIGEWVLNQASKRKVAYELVLVKDYALPLIGEKDAPEKINKWRNKIAELDGFVFVTAEYNHSIPGALKNALDLAFEPWFNKAAGIISYGYAGGARAAEHLRTILSALAIADVQTHVLFNLNTEVSETNGFVPAKHQADLTAKVFDQVERWALALASTRK
jgi:NAD(P)H-dependent FMN reductase